VVALDQSQRIKYKATIQYLGTGYHGWQKQLNCATVQEVIESRLSRLAGESIKVVGASRTDAGVHAKGQVAHFLFPKKNSVPDLKKAVNAILPSDIRVKLLSEVPPSFHAQRHARRKRYEYHIYHGEVFPPFLCHRAIHVGHSLDLSLLNRAASLFLGTHDFSGFAASSTTVRNRVRSLSVSNFKKSGAHFIYRVEADGFLHHMIRNIVGTLLEISSGKLEMQAVPEILRCKNRSMAGPTAPAEGLYLVRIWY
jgi:tRNA pseudouridine38-40 synthase